jgi:hypothetical protein
MYVEHHIAWEIQNVINLERDAWSTDQLLTYYYKKREREIDRYNTIVHACMVGTTTCLADGES